ncbi:MAG: hypothetical protein M3135_00300, partial [Actinomycetota bacterium]|nr:hypothetical protein [Actinomycetota bacterium]
MAPTTSTTPPMIAQMPQAGNPERGGPGGGAAGYPGAAAGGGARGGPVAACGARPAPQFPQKRVVPGFSVPHLAHRTVG